MNDQDSTLFDPRFADWLEGDPNTAPEQALQVVLAAFPSIRQRHGSRLPWRFRTMPTSFKLALGAMAVIAVVLGGAYLLRPPTPDGSVGGPGLTPSPIASPRPSTSAAGDAVTWISYTSARYGFTAAIPTTFTTMPSTKFWVIPESDTTTTSEWDLLYGGPGDNTWAASSVRVPDGMTNDVWLTAYRQNQVEPALPPACASPSQKATPVTIDGRSGTMRVGCGEMEAIVFAGGLAYSFSGWTEESGAVGVPAEFRALFDHWLTTIKLDPASAIEPPTASPSPRASPKPS